jgi:hypothetical protein
VKRPIGGREDVVAGRGDAPSRPAMVSPATRSAGMGDVPVIGEYLTTSATHKRIPSKTNANLSTISIKFMKIYS